MKYEIGKYDFIAFKLTIIDLAKVEYTRGFLGHQAVQYRKESGKRFIVRNGMDTVEGFETVEDACAAISRIASVILKRRQTMHETSGTAIAEAQAKILRMTHPEVSHGKTLIKLAEANATISELEEIIKDVLFINDGGKVFNNYKDGIDHAESHPYLRELLKDT